MGKRNKVRIKAVIILSFLLVFLVFSIYVYHQYKIIKEKSLLKYEGNLNLFSEIGWHVNNEGNGEYVHFLNRSEM
ncbi:hypothetical protein [Priestia filamentosa]|uniref:Uncharacterized protein n=1 Tax=Priestia filamentosa TaxID=1402861 RepID=A0A1X7F498_9BACI|nr:hypothetical protein [Priestia filamentosa]AKO91649.1 hypothetical protein BEH_05745 [Priestia filamentosa]MDT3761764.1 hypothetical protein [Priestia filamentosa]OXS67857.1 hypothetical protein B1B01_14875 [Priestia filamentosa]RJS64943.1 hypothetical protein CJ485_09310 [Priestia filamentosa]WCM16859.1 hypothetical protein PGN40_05790 [Priestia filamentosa]